MPKHRLPSVFAFLLASAGCQVLSTVPVPGDLRLTTEDTLFRRGPADGWVNVPFRVENRGGMIFHILRCGARVSANVERRERGEWRQHSGAVCPAVYPMNPMPLGPAEARTGVRGIGEPGTYRLRLSVVDRTGRSSVSVFSNPFIVE